MEARAAASQRNSSATKQGEAASATNQGDAAAGARQADAAAVTKLAEGSPVTKMLSSNAALLRESMQRQYMEFDRLAAGNSSRAQEYSRMADVASGMAVFVDQLHSKNEELRGMLAEVEEVDAQLSELEAVVATLDSFTASLEAKISAPPKTE